jgi:peptide/nickel transport system ATP-binding protein
MSATSPLVEVTGLKRHFPLPRRSLLGAGGTVRAVDGVNFAIAPGRSFGVVGESGSGKSTVARLVMALDLPSEGEVSILGKNLFRLDREGLRRHRRHFQMVFQDPYGSLDPRHTVGRIVAEPLGGLGLPMSTAERAERVRESLAAVGLPGDSESRYPHEFSGGQRQRIAIARALITKPSLIVADEPVSALDVSVQAQVLNLMRDLERQHGVTYLFISHNLAVVEHVAAEVAVMFQGLIVEHAPADGMFARPAHPYTQALMKAVPGLVKGQRRRDHRGRKLAAAPFDATPPPAVGCPYVLRCPIAVDRCRRETPALREIAGGHRAACHLA